MVKVHLCTTCLNAAGVCVDAFPSLCLHLCRLSYKSEELLPLSAWKDENVFPNVRSISSFILLFFFFFLFFFIFLKNSLHVRRHSCNDISEYLLSHLLLQGNKKKKSCTGSAILFKLPSGPSAPSWQCKQFYRTWFFLLLFFFSSD